ncbi:MAG TPA: 2-phosphosulfolactate phosphatase, partial [Acidimicrobiales bacterium]
AASHPHVAVIGAGARQEFREEDALCCGWIAGGLLDAGYVSWDDGTAELVERWRSATPSDFADNRSATFLRDTQQEDDLDFILTHVDDLELVARLVDGELRIVP